jgi:pimeloyl-ACP methyl ester carboxylesterase
MSEIMFAQRSVEVGGRALRYAEAGSGEAVVCLDGMLGMRPSRAHALMAERRRVIVFAMPEEGSSAPAALARRIGEALAKLGIARFDLMGHGLGAGATLWLGLENLKSVGAITLVAPTVLRREAAPPLSAAELKAALHAHPERHPDPPRARPIAEPEGGEELERRLGDLKLPVLALFGTNDPIAPPECADRYRALLPDCNLMFVYDAAHAIDIDRPEAIAFIGLEFFERHDLFLVSRDSGLAFP